MSINATGEWPQSGYVVNGYLVTWLEDALHRLYQTSYVNTWSFPNGKHVVQIAGSYSAAIAGEVQYQADWLHFKFQRAVDSDTATVKWEIGYTFFGPAVRINGPTTVDPWTSFEVDADVADPGMVPPITYSWTRNGSPLSYTEDYFVYPGREMGVDHDFQVTITDSNGMTATAEHHVHTKLCDFPGCLEQ